MGNITLTIELVDDSLQTRLRLSAASHGRTIEEEARQILKQVLVDKTSSTGMGTRIMHRFAAVDGVDLPVVDRSVPRAPPKMGWDDSE